MILPIPFYRGAGWLNSCLDCSTQLLGMGVKLEGGPHLWAKRLGGRDAPQPLALLCPLTPDTPVGPKPPLPLSFLCPHPAQPLSLSFSCLFLSALCEGRACFPVLCSLAHEWDRGRWLRPCVLLCICEGHVPFDVLGFSHSRVVQLPTEVGLVDSKGVEGGAHKSKKRGLDRSLAM